MDARLLVAHANADAKQIRLGAETLIGRSPECNLRIASGQVSRRHCLIKVAEELVSVRDLGSANGTRLNGQAIAAEEDVIVPPGSTLVVGPLKFIVQFTPPKADGDTELLFRSGQSESSETHDVQAMATAPVADGEETKDYPPSRTRKRGVPPPVVVSGEGAGDGPGDSNAEGGRGENRSVQARTTEADFGPISGETVFDVSLEDQAAADAKRRRDAAGAQRSPVGAETDFVFEEEDLRQLASAVEEAALQAPPAPGSSPVEDSPHAEKPPPQPGWRLLEMLRRPKKPAAANREDAPSPPPAPPDADDALQNFLKDQ